MTSTSRRIALGILLLIAPALGLGCASTSPPSWGSVVIVSDRPTDEGVTAPEATQNGTLAEPLETGAEAAADSDELAETADETEAAAEAEAGVKPLDQALTWAVEGLRAYAAGDLDTARRKLSDARIVLLTAELPPAMEEKGIGLLNCCLPADVARYDLVAIERELETEPHDLPEREVVARELRRILTRFGSQPPERDFQTLLDEVETYIEFYRGSYREFFERAYLRKHKYWPTIEAVFAEYRLPTELGYIAFVESGFNPRAYSRARARGLWQFIGSTGRRYGLRRTDDFYDVARSTRAAAEYLRDLLSIFGAQSFLLATAAYNAGELRVMGCLRGVDDPFAGRSFWEIRGCFAPETREYVPRILAAAVISTDPRRFGFDLETADEVLARYQVVTIRQPTSLARIAQLAGTSAGEIRAANSDLTSTATATPVANFPLYLPAGSGDSVAATFGGDGLGAPLDSGDGAEGGDGHGRIAEGRGGSSAGTVEPATRTYVVRRGDTLSGIAARFGRPYREIAALNGLRSPYRLSVGQRLIVQARDGAGGNSSGSRRTDGRSRIVYTVQTGNTLVAIAEIFSVRYTDIMSWNGLRSSRLRAGQKLVIHPPQEFNSRSHQVRQGETPATIARRHGVSVDSLLAANGLGPRTPIHPGQRLVVYVPR